MTDKKTAFRGLNALLDDTPVLSKEEGDGIQSGSKGAGGEETVEEKAAREATEAAAEAAAAEEEEAAGKGIKTKTKPAGVTVTREEGDEEETPEEKVAREAAEAAAAEEDEEETPEEKVAREAAEAEEDENSTFFTRAASSTGYEVEGDFEENEEGFIAYADALSDAKANDMVQAQFSKNPLVKTFIDFLDQGGKPEAFFQVQHPVTDYSKVAIPEGDDASAKAMAEHYFQRKGLPNVQVAHLVTLAIEAGTLRDDAIGYLAEMNQEQQTEKQVQLADTKAAKKAQDAKDLLYWGEVETTVMGGKIGQITIPQKGRKDFYNWLTVPVNKEGQSQRDIDFGALTEDESLVMEWMVHNKFTALYNKATKPAKGKKAADDAVETMLTKSKKAKGKGGSEVVVPPQGSKATFKPIGDIL